MSVFQFALFLHDELFIVLAFGVSRMPSVTKPILLVGKKDAPNIAISKTYLIFHLSTFIRGWREIQHSQ